MVSLYLILGCSGDVDCWVIADILLDAVERVIRS